jgi:hypothetical protein
VEGNHPQNANMLSKHFSVQISRRASVAVTSASEKGGQSKNNQRARLKKINNNHWGTMT